ncbi:MULTISPECIES: OmpA family protein [unclassified Streptomyces]|uniref:OmpA family protein n=1 Tax=unclassified Streptomyces TaxID=2593676 RepID=UPI003246F471
MTRTRHAAVAIAAALVLTAGGTTAYADETPSSPPLPGTEATSDPSMKVDGTSPNLKLPEGGTLAAPKVLDIKSIVEDQGGEERRSDTNTSVTFALQAEVLFAMDSAALSPDANDRIQGIAAEIKKQKATNVRVFGFTDNLGTHEHGVVLSKERADAVQKALSLSLGPDVTFEIRGYAEDYPISDNSTEDGRKKNRRVEVSFTRSSG